MIYIFPGSVHIFSCSRRIDRPINCGNIHVNRSQTHECGNWDCGRAILFWEYLFWIFGIVTLHCTLLNLYLGKLGTKGQGGGRVTSCPTPLFFRELYLCKYVFCIFYNFFPSYTNKKKGKNALKRGPESACIVFGIKLQYALNCLGSLFWEIYGFHGSLIRLAVRD